jgi:hypothetical protein
MSKYYYQIDEKGGVIGQYNCPQEFDTIFADEDEVKCFISPKYDGKKWIEDIVKLHNAKIEKFNSVRKNLFFLTATPITQQYITEKDLLNKNSSFVRKITEDEYEKWLNIWQRWRDLPDQPNFNNLIDSLSLDEINETNTVLWGTDYYIP